MLLVNDTLFISTSNFLPLIHGNTIFTSLAYAILLVSLIIPSSLFCRVHQIFYIDNRVVCE